MKDWVKTVIWVLIGFCLISAFVGIFELFAFLQTCSHQVRNLEINDKTKTLLIVATAVSIVGAVASVAIIAVTIKTIVKDVKNKKRIVARLVAVLVVSILLIVLSFLSLELLRIEAFGAVSGWNSMYYEEFSHCQLYLSAALSTFLPLLVAAGTELGYYLFNLKKQKAEQTAIADSENNA